MRVSKIFTETDIEEVNNGTESRGQEETDTNHIFDWRLFQLFITALKSTSIFSALNQYELYLLINL